MFERFTERARKVMAEKEGRFGGREIDGVSFRVGRRRPRVIRLDEASFNPPTIDAVARIEPHEDNNT